MVKRILHFSFASVLLDILNIHIFLDMITYTWLIFQIPLATLGMYGNQRKIIRISYDRCSFKLSLHHLYINGAKIIISIQWRFLINIIKVQRNIWYMFCYGQKITKSYETEINQFYIVLHRRKFSFRWQTN